MKHTPIDDKIVKARRSRTTNISSIQRTGEQVCNVEVHPAPTNTEPTESKDVINNVTSSSRESSNIVATSKDSTHSTGSSIPSNTSSKNTKSEWTPAELVFDSNSDGINSNHSNIPVSTRRGSLPANQNINRASLGLPVEKHKRTQSVQLVDPMYGDESGYKRYIGFSFTGLTFLDH